MLLAETVLKSVEEVFGALNCTKYVLNDKQGITVSHPRASVNFLVKCNTQNSSQFYPKVKPMPALKHRGEVKQVAKCGSQ